MFLRVKITVLGDFAEKTKAMIKVKIIRADNCLREFVEIYTFRRLYLADNFFVSKKIGLEYIGFRRFCNCF